MKPVSLSLLIAGCAVLWPCWSAATESVTCTTAGTTRTCSIIEPTVIKAQTTYPTILFHPGSFVTIHAGGCVQSGGGGQTWHRYVDPSGPNSDHLYHGLIAYPGSGGLVRFAPSSQTPAGWSFQIPANAQDNTALVLGFEDDGYGDNGYWGHDRDNGPNGQCPTPGSPQADRGKPAWVTISMQATGAVPAHKAMDLVSNMVDPNNLPLNPWWGYEKGEDHLAGDPSGAPDPGRQCGLRYIDPDNVDLGITLAGNHCTTQAPSVNQGTGFNGELCRSAAESGVLAGHLNWFVSTYTGRIRWDDWSGTFRPTDPTGSGDDDYNFVLYPDSKSGLTAARPDWIGLEFDSDEVVDRIDKGWWNDFHNQVKANGGPQSAAGQSINDAPAIVIGLMGLDSEHGAYSELHPVYGLAIHLSTATSDATSDDWSFMARNFGNEGYCADGNMTVPQLSTLSFFIERPGAIGDDPANPTSLSDLYSSTDTNGVALSFVPGGAIITFTLGEPSKETVYSGHVIFHWKMQPARPGGTTVPTGVRLGRIGGPTTGAPVERMTLKRNQIFVNGVPTDIDVDAEGLKERVLEDFPAALKPQLDAAMTRTRAVPHAWAVHRVVSPPQAGGPAIGLRKALPTYMRPVKVPDPKAAGQQAQMLRLFCEAYPGGVSPHVTVKPCGRAPLHPLPHPTLPPVRLR